MRARPVFAEYMLPRLRRIVLEQLSALTINPAFRREPPRGPQRRRWFILETATSVWSIGVVGAALAGLIPLRVLLVYAAILSGIAMLNQIRTLVAHLWESDGTPLSITEQYLDSMNVPPPGWLPELWAPVGLRYHALHHLLPGIPYHRLGEADRRLTAMLPAGSDFPPGDHRGLVQNLRRLAIATRRSAKGCSMSGLNQQQQFAGRHDFEDLAIDHAHLFPRFQGPMPGTRIGARASRRLLVQFVAQFENDQARAIVPYAPMPSQHGFGWLR